MVTQEYNFKTNQYVNELKTSTIVNLDVLEYDSEIKMTISHIF